MIPSTPTVQVIFPTGPHAASCAHSLPGSSSAGLCPSGEAVWSLDFPDFSPRAGWPAAPGGRDGAAPTPGAPVGRGEGGAAMARRERVLAWQTR
jgi:hypothetical protein